ncbi:hypothetical protein V6O07_15330, partial [Arthrospira platensis SPKY2]
MPTIFLLFNPRFNPLWLNLLEQIECFNPIKASHQGFGGFSKTPSFDSPTRSGFLCCFAASRAQRFS